MAAIENEHVYGIQIRESANDGSDFSNPDADYRLAFLGEDGLWHVKDSAGTVTDPFTGAGSVATDTIWDAAGDLAVGSGANTAARLAIGATNGMAVMRVAGAAAWALPQGHELSYVEKTSDTSITNSVEASADTIVTAAAISFDGSTRVKIEFFTDQVVTPAVVNTGAQIILFDGSSPIGLMARTRTSANAVMRTPVYCVRYLTPSNASHTYSIRAIVESGQTATVGGGAGGSGPTQMPAFIRISIA